MLPLLMALLAYTPSRQQCRIYLSAGIVWLASLLNYRARHHPIVVTQSFTCLFISEHCKFSSPAKE